MNPYYTTKKNGTGLGLSIVNKIINDHHGELEFYAIKDGALFQPIYKGKRSDLDETAAVISQLKYKID